MRELLAFVEDKIQSGMFIGLNTEQASVDLTSYTVDYWVDDTETNEFGVLVNIKSGKQKTFTF